MGGDQVTLQLRAVAINKWASAGFPKGNRVGKPIRDILQPKLRVLGKHSIGNRRPGSGGLAAAHDGNRWGQCGGVCFQTRINAQGSRVIACAHDSNPGVVRSASAWIKGIWIVVQNVIVSWCRGAFVRTEMQTG